MTTWTCTCRRSSMIPHSNLYLPFLLRVLWTTSSALKVLPPRHGEAWPWNELTSQTTPPTVLGTRFESFDYGCLYIAHQQASQGPDDFRMHATLQGFASVAKSAFSWLEHWLQSSSGQRKTSWNTACFQSDSCLGFSLGRSPWSSSTPLPFLMTLQPKSHNFSLKSCPFPGTLPLPLPLILPSIE